MDCELMRAGIPDLEARWRIERTLGECGPKLLAAVEATGPILDGSSRKGCALKFCSVSGR